MTKTFQGNILCLILLSITLLFTFSCSKEKNEPQEPTECNCECDCEEEIVEEVEEEEEDIHEWVDLGLPSGTLWATCNVGAIAERPTSVGYFFAWGETKPREYGDLKLYAWANKDNEFLQKLGVVDENGNLIEEYDAATANWGKNWRMPTKEEIEELFELENDVAILYKMIYGWEFRGTNGNTLFIPCQEVDGNYNYRIFCWSSSVIEYANFTRSHGIGGSIYFNNIEKRHVYLDWCDRDKNLGTIRAVRKK